MVNFNLLEKFLFIMPEKLMVVSAWMFPFLSVLYLSEYYLLSFVGQTIITYQGAVNVEEGIIP